ncbi:cation-translocating P-type ATPase [Roseateles sp.]|jgi:Ca2+-transporting ATPase|uniref:cation-translocating P-type ATPase n=1 Tax=Roseateles sp. TaxID=1971397 RepID=UPI0037C84BED
MNEAPPRGLSAEEAARRLQADGPNELNPPQRRRWWQMLAELLREPMLLLLLAAGGIYLLLGDRGEALMLLGFVAVTVLISLSQEQRTERVLEALRDLTSPRALVRRDGETQRIAGREVVLGDLLLLADGDRVAADATLITAHDLQLDESLLSGESLPVDKRVGAEGDVARVFAGTLVTGGQALAQVTATGPRSEIGRIGKSLSDIGAPPTPLHRQTRRLVRLFSVLGLVVSAVVVTLWGLLRGDWLGGLLAGISLAMSMLPQEFLLILTVFMAMGAWRLSRQRVLARRAATIETLGSATVLCSDKTGTLTLNKMAVAELAGAAGAGLTWRDDGKVLPEALHPLLEHAILASESEASDPMERALHALGQQRLPAHRQHPAWTLVHEYALSGALPAMTHVWRGDAGQVVSIKGASEAVAGLCRLPPEGQAALAQQATAMAARGLRVLGVARAVWPADQAWPESPAGFAWEWLGLVGFADPLRPEVPAAIRECRAAGLRVLMITGDHPVTAAAIAEQAGLDGGLPALTGTEIAAMDDAALAQALRRHAVYARIRPEQKLRIVQALRAQGEVVAMTGDGVNDAPSLKAADIGVAMGGRGTDVAREAAGLVLLDDNFDAITQAVRLGRRIYDNLRKAMAFVLAVHVPIAGLSLLPLLLGWPPLLTPVHIAFLELLIDPVCSVVFEAEPEEDDVMQRPPRDPAAPLFSPGLLAWSAAQGLVLLALVAGLYALARLGLPADSARALAFVALVSGNVALILANRSASGRWFAGWLRPNALLWKVLGATALLLAAALAITPLREVFRFVLPPWPWLAAALGCGLLCGLLLELLKQAWPRRWRG